MCPPDAILFVKPFAGLRSRFLALQPLSYGKADAADKYSAAKAQEYQDQWGDGHSNTSHAALASTDDASIKTAVATQRANERFAMAHAKTIGASDAAKNPRATAMAKPPRPKLWGGKAGRDAAPAFSPHGGDGEKV